MEKPPPIAEEDICQVAGRLPTDERAAYLDAACENDLGLRARVERLLRSGLG